MSARSRRNPRANRRDVAANTAPQRSVPTRPVPELRAVQMLQSLKATWSWLARQKGLQLLQPRTRRLQVHETVQLGDKRFVSILRVDGEQFLIGGSPSGVSLLAELKPDTPATFSAVLETESRQACA